MSKVIRITESDLLKSISTILSEQVVQGKGADPYEYKKEGDKYYTRRKGVGEWILTKDKVSDAIASKIFKTTTSTGSEKNNGEVNNPKKTTSNDDFSKVIIDKTLGDKFRNWVNDNYPQYAKEIQLDRSGSYDNSYIRKAFSKYGGEFVLSKGKNSESTNTDLVKVMLGINPDFKKQINFDRLSTTDTTPKVCTPNDENCAQFVNDIDDRVTSVGNAWTAYRNDSLLGPTKFSAFKNLKPETIKDVIALWQEIDKRGGGQENGPSSKKIRDLVDNLVPKKGSSFTNIKPGDYIGIFYPPSSHHEEAFYEGGQAWFVDGKPGKNIQAGNGWGMNTHLGIVGAVKDGVPLVFHNVGGNVISDPISNLRVAWVKRKS